jgi:hypothetical protein
VTFGAINNDSVDEGYGDFTAGMSASITPEMSYPLSVTIEPVDNEFISAFFDWNRDGDFKDAGEEVVVATLADTAGPHTVSVDVPAGSATGDIRMRIVLSWTDPPVSFGTITDGEAEDYTVYIPGPTITATAGVNGTITPEGVIQKSSGENQAFTITPDFGFFVADVLVDDVSVGQVSSYTFSNISASHTIAATFSQYMWPPISSYDYSLEWITNVNFGGIDNTTGADGYADYSGGTPANLSTGMSYPLSVGIEPSIDGDENVHAFFDWNSDGDFTDPGEEVVVATMVSTAGPHTVSVSVPIDAVGGVTRMRVVLRYFDPPPSSGIIDWGEAEDYAVVLSLSPVITATAGPGGTIDPIGDVAVTSGATQAFTVTPAANYHLVAVVGCGGALVDNTYTTGPITANCTVAATFAIDTFSLNVRVTGDGGSVTSDVAGINCPGNCTAVYDYGTTVILTATATEYEFIDWSGDCTGTTLTCTVVMDQIRAVTAEFDSFPWELFYPAMAMPSPPQ